MNEKWGYLLIGIAIGLIMYSLVSIHLNLRSIMKDLEEIEEYQDEFIKRLQRDYQMGTDQLR